MKILLITKIKERLNGKKNEKEFELWSAHKDIRSPYSRNNKTDNIIKTDNEIS